MLQQNQRKHGNRFGELPQSNPPLCQAVLKQKCLRDRLEGSLASLYLPVTRVALGKQRVLACLDALKDVPGPCPGVGK